MSSEKPHSEHDHKGPAGVLSQPDVAALAAAIEEVGRRIGTLLRAEPDPNVTALGHWTVQDLAVHLVTGTDMYRGMLAGTASPYQRFEDFAAQSDTLLETFDGDRSLPVLATQLETSAAELGRELVATPTDRPMGWHAGLPVPLSTLAATLLGELVVHGLDLARASGQRWDIEPGHASGIFWGLLPVVPYYVDRQAAADTVATYELRVQGVPAVHLAFQRGELTVTPANGDTADCKITAEPVTWLLTSYGRVSPLRGALTGKIRAGGRKPWLAFSFDRLLRSP